MFNKRCFGGVDVFLVYVLVFFVIGVFLGVVCVFCVGVGVGVLVVGCFVGVVVVGEVLIVFLDFLGFGVVLLD